MHRDPARNYATEVIGASELSLPHSLTLFLSFSIFSLTSNPLLPTPPSSFTSFSEIMIFLNSDIYLVIWVAAILRFEINEKILSRVEGKVTAYLRQCSNISC
ncbi:hypothetical protein RIF29_34566 [Crotalaria pallida]|uniref:Uncharacterized protein n=1 Tax=Crotalaria pallida TaxID=3830 RepID=A0AAN9HTE5_CROPI